MAWFDRQPVLQAKEEKFEGEGGGYLVKIGSKMSLNVGTIFVCAFLLVAGCNGFKPSAWPTAHGNSFRSALLGQSSRFRASFLACFD